MSEATKAHVLKPRWNRYPNHNYEDSLCVFAALLTKMELTTAWSKTKNGQDVITALMGGPHLEVSESGMPGNVLLPDPASAKPLPSSHSARFGNAADSVSPGDQDRLPGAELRRTRQGIGKSGSGRAASFLEAAFIHAGPRRQDRAAEKLQPGRSRSGTGDHHRAHLPQAAAGRRCSRLHSRLHLSQRCHGAGFAEKRRPVHARQRLRHVLSGWTGDRNRPRHLAASGAGAW